MASLKGGLVFELHTKHPIQINPKYKLLSKQVQTQTLLDTIKVLNATTQAYQNFCQNTQIQIRNSFLNSKQIDPYPFVLFKTADDYDIKDAENICKTHKGRIPEIRDYTAYSSLSDFLFKHKIPKATAGIYYDPTTQAYRFKSDQAKADQAIRKVFPTVYYHKYDYYSPYIIDPLKDEAKQNSIDKQFTYNNRDGLLELYVGYINTENLPVVCEKPHYVKPDITETITNQWTIHNCKENIKILQSSTESIIREMNSIIPDDNTDTSQAETIILSQNNTDLPLVNTTQQAIKIIEALAHNMQTDFLVTPELAKAWIVHNLLTSQDLTSIEFKRFIQVITDFKDHIMARINKTPQEQIEAYVAKNDNDKITPQLNTTNFAQLKDNTYKYQADISNIQQILYLPQEDIRIRNRRNIAIKMTPVAVETNKMAEQIINTQPVIERKDINLNQQELTMGQNVLKSIITKLGANSQTQSNAQMAHKLEQQARNAIINIQKLIKIVLGKHKDIITAAMAGRPSPYALSEQDFNSTIDIKGIKAFPMTQKGSTYIILQAPVIDSHLDYYFLSIKPIPLFLHEQTYVIQNDLQHIAINENFTKYAMVSDQEYLTCTTSAQPCIIADIPRDTNIQAHCTIATYTQNKNMCPIIEINKAPQMLSLYNYNHLIYSTPQPINIELQCPEYQAHTETQLKGYGEVSIPTKCHMTVNNQSYFIEKNIEETRPYFLSKAPNLSNAATAQAYQQQMIELQQLIDTHTISFRDRYLEKFYDIPYQIVTFIQVMITTILILAIAYCLAHKHKKTRPNEPTNKANHETNKVDPSTRANNEIQTFNKGHTDTRITIKPITMNTIPQKQQKPKSINRIKKIMGIRSKSVDITTCKQTCISMQNLGQ